MMLLVPAPIENMNAVNGAMSVICLGCFSMTRAATDTIQSMPPAACIIAAVVTTARMMASAAAGGSPGASPKMKTSTKVPRPPHRPTPTPPARVPMTMAPRTTTASSTNDTLISFPCSPAVLPTSSTDAGSWSGVRPALPVGHVLHDGPGIREVGQRLLNLRAHSRARLGPGLDRGFLDRSKLGAHCGDGCIETSLGDCLELVELSRDLLGPRAELVRLGADRPLIEEGVHRVGQLVIPCAEVLRLRRTGVVAGGEHREAADQPKRQAHDSPGAAGSCIPHVHAATVDVAPNSVT